MDGCGRSPPSPGLVRCLKGWDVKSCASAPHGMHRDDFVRLCCLLLFFSLPHLNKVIISNSCVHSCLRLKWKYTIKMWVLKRIDWLSNRRTDLLETSCTNCRGRGQKLLWLLCLHCPCDVIILRHVLQRTAMHHPREVRVDWASSDLHGILTAV
jgi:hypothetical protein